MTMNINKHRPSIQQKRESSTIFVQKKTLVNEYSTSTSGIVVSRVEIFCCEKKKLM